MANEIQKALAQVFVAETKKLTEHFDASNVLRERQTELALTPEVMEYNRITRQLQERDFEERQLKSAVALSAMMFLKGDEP